MGICVLDSAEGALRDLRKFFLTNNLRLVKKVLSSSKLLVHMKKTGNPKILHLMYISHILTWLYDILDYFTCFGVLIPAEGALRDPRKNFLTNNLRFVKKVLSSSKLSANMKKRGNSKNHTFDTYISHFDTIIWHFWSILHVSVFWFQQRVLCGIQENFSWQTIWDLSKKFWAPANSQLIWRNVEIRKIIHLTRPQYLAFCRHHHTDSVLIPAEGALRDPRKFFLTNNLRLGAYLLIQNGKPE